MVEMTATAGPAHVANSNKALFQMLSNLCFILGFASIVASIVAWVLFKDPDPAHGERFGIFIGLWAPTFFALSNRLDRYSL